MANSHPNIEGEEEEEEEEGEGGEERFIFRVVASLLQMQINRLEQQS